jgi:TrmH family RNA methyltransferase
MKESRQEHRGFAVHPEWASALKNVRFVLVETTHPGNIGAVARVMKNMGVENLTLVSSTSCGPESDAFSMASGAYDIVERATRVGNLRQAVSDCIAAVGTSARLGRKRWTALTPEQIIPELMERARVGPVACVFGRESRGLTNEEIKVCTHHMIIPTDMRFASMNIAHAAAVAAYEIYKVACRAVGFAVWKYTPASVRSREQMYDHIETVLVRARFLEFSNPLRMMRDIRRILNSAQLDERDVKVIRGIFRKIGNVVRIQDEKIRTLKAECVNARPVSNGERHD